jgi:hypothetical protein
MIRTKQHNVTTTYCGHDPNICPAYKSPADDRVFFVEKVGHNVSITTP